MLKKKIELEKIKSIDESGFNTEDNPEKNENFFPGTLRISVRNNDKRKDYVFVNGKELSFTEQYESMMNEYEMLNILKENLSENGKKSFDKIGKYLLENADKYLVVCNKIN